MRDTIYCVATVYIHKIMRSREKFKPVKQGGGLWISCGFLSVLVSANSRVTFSDRTKNLQDQAEILSK